jgi:hypothetical protein
MDLPFQLAFYRYHPFAIPEFRMMRFCRLFCCLDREQTANGMSISIVVFALLFLHLESSPTPAGADIARRPSNKLAFVIAAAKGESAVHKTEGVPTDLTPEQQAEKSMAEKIRLIEQGLVFLSGATDYTAQFTKQELVNGELLDEQEIEMKIRHAPFSVYLKWVTGEVGREVLYVDGANDGQLTAHGGGWKARLPAISLEPTSRIAMAESRYPITKAGLHDLAKMMAEVHRQDLQKKNFTRCEKLADQTFDNRPCHAFMIEYKDPKSSEQYRKSITLIDKEWSIPIYTKNFGWLNTDAPADPEKLDEATLIECYSYSGVKFRPNLIAADFDRSNEDYGFKRQ